MCDDHDRYSRDQSTQVYLDEYATHLECIEKYADTTPKFVAELKSRYFILYLENAKLNRKKG